MHLYQDLISIFDQCFLKEWNTVLLKGEDEPIYLPAGEGRVHNQVMFAHGFYRSALHEIAHWCVAGDQRRTQVDFGYWYEPDGRSLEQQRAFYKVEVKPQALEWMFCVAAGHDFAVSTDNLHLNPEQLADDEQQFKANVSTQVHTYLAEGIPERPKRFIDALLNFYGNAPLDSNAFKLNPIEVEF